MAEASAAAFFLSVKSRTPSSSKIGDSAGMEPVSSYSAVNLRVTILLASTSGWLKGLIPMMEPATAVAISQRKNSWPRSMMSAMGMRTTGWPARSSFVTASSCDGSSAGSRLR